MGFGYIEGEIFMYNYGYDYGYSADAAASTLGVLGGLFFGIMIFSSIIGLIAIISYAKIFKKAGKPWWASIVPIYNTIVMIEIAKLPLWYIALFFIPIANIYAIFKINIEMAKKFGKGTGFGIGMTLLSIIFIPLLAFSDNKYELDDVNIETVNNQFDANSIINNNVAGDNSSIGSVNDIPVAPVVDESMSIENNPFAPVQGTASAENISVEPTPQVVEPVQDISVAPIMQEAEPIENISVEPAPQVVEPVQDISVAPIMQETEPIENSSVEPAPQVVEPVQDISVAPIMQETATVQNVDVIQPEPTVNAFNISPQPVVEPVINPIETISVNEPVVTEQLNVSSTEVDLAQNVVEDKKVCKNCGNELPDIVSICPNCGTDNE